MIGLLKAEGRSKSKPYLLRRVSLPQDGEISIVFVRFCL